MPKVTITFEGDNMDAAMHEAWRTVEEYRDLYSNKPSVLVPDPAANGEAKEETILHNDQPLDNKAILHCALDLLMTVYSSDKVNHNGIQAIDAVNKLLDKYSVDSLNDIEPEKAAELFTDAEQIATDYGVSN